jgi:hypothetical protein
MATFTWAGGPSRVVTKSVYLSYIEAPAMRAARNTWCGAILGKSIPVDRSTDDSTERSEWAGMELLTEQMDCRYMDAFYAELDYAARNRLLGERAWQACQSANQLETALDLANYMQCLRGIGGGTVEQDSLFEERGLLLDSHPQTEASPAGNRQPLELPAQITFAGQIRTGFYNNCCLFGRGFTMPFSYLHLTNAVIISDDGGIGTVTVRDIQLDRDVPASLVNQPVNASCNLHSGITGHHALSVYCDGTQIKP